MSRRMDDSSVEKLIKAHLRETRDYGTSLVLGDQSVISMLRDAFAFGFDIGVGEGRPADTRTLCVLRDQFAGLAMQALLSNAEFGRNTPDEDLLNDIAVIAHQTADAMLKARTA